METNEMNIQRNNGIFRVFRITGLVIGGVILAAFFAIVFGYFVMLLWNWLMPTLFGLSEITYWHAFGIIILARLLFGGHNHGYDHDYSKTRSSSNKSRFIRWVKYGKRGNQSSNSQKWNNWRHYDEWWSEEGEKGFNEYVNKKKEEDK